MNKITLDLSKIVTVEQVKAKKAFDKRQARASKPVIKEAKVNKVKEVKFCAECNSESEGAEFCYHCAPYMVTESKEEVMATVSHDWTIEVKAEEAVARKTSKKFKAEQAYDLWMKENAHLLGEGVHTEESWEEEVIKESANLKECFREIALLRGEEQDMALWTGKRKSSGIKSEDQSVTYSESYTDFGDYDIYSQYVDEALNTPVEEDLTPCLLSEMIVDDMSDEDDEEEVEEISYEEAYKTALKIQRENDGLDNMISKFKSGINDGTCFDKLIVPQLVKVSKGEKTKTVLTMVTVRNSYFEMGLTPDQVHVPAYGIVMNQADVHDFEKKESSVIKHLTADLVKKTQEITIPNLDWGNENVDHILALAKGKLEAEVEASTCLADAVKFLYPHGELASKILTNTTFEHSEGERHMPYSFKGWREMSFNGLSYDAAMEAFTRTKTMSYTKKFVDVDNNGELVITEKKVSYEKRVVLTKNGELIAELESYLRKLILKKYAQVFRKSRAAFIAVVNEANKLLARSGYVKTVETFKKSNEATRKLIDVAVRHANSRFNEDRFDSKVWSVLVGAGFIKAKKAVVSSEMNQWIARANASDLEGISAAIAKEIIKAARSNAKTGGEVLDRDVYDVVREISLAA